MNKCEDVAEFVNTTIIDYTPELISYDSTHLIVENTPLEVIPHKCEEVHHLIFTLSYEFYPMKCDICSGTIDNIFMIILDDKIMSIIMNSEKDYNIYNELVEITSLNSITNIMNYNLYCTMVDEEDTVIYCVKSDVMIKDEIEIVLKGKELIIQSNKNDVLDKYIKYVNEITDKVTEYLNTTLSASNRYLKEKRQKDISLKTYPLNDDSSFIDNINNKKYVILNNINILKLESIIKTYDNKIMTSYHIELDTEYLVNENDYSILNDNDKVYYFMMSRDEDIYYKSKTIPSGDIDYDKLTKSVFENEKVIINKSINIMNEMANNIIISMDEYYTRYGKNSIKENGIEILLIYTGKEYVEMYEIDDNLFKYVYKLDKINGLNNKFNVEMLDEDKSQIKLSSDSKYIKTCKNKIKSSESYSIKEIKEICPEINSFINNKMNLKLPFTLQSTISVRKDGVIYKKLIINRENEIIKRILSNENRIKLVDGIINSSLETENVNLSNKYIMRTIFSYLQYLTSNYKMTIVSDDGYNGYCTVYIEKFNQTLIENEVTTFCYINYFYKYKCFSFKNDEEFVYCTSGDKKFYITGLLDVNRYDHYMKIDEIKIDEIKVLKNCYTEMKNIIQNEIEKEEKIIDNNEELLLKNNINKRTIKTTEEEEEESNDDEKMIEINGIYEDIFPLYLSYIITNNILYQIIKKGENRFQILYKITITRNDELYFVKILGVDEENTGLYNGNNEFKQLKIEDFPKEIKNNIRVNINDNYEMTEDDKQFILPLYKHTIKLIKCSKSDIKALFNMVSILTKPVSKPFHNKMDTKYKELNVWFTEGFYVTSKEDNEYNNYENVIGLNNYLDIDNKYNNNTHTKFYDFYYAFDVNNKVYTSKYEYIEYFKYINNTYTPSLYSDKISVLTKTLKYMESITNTIQNVIDNIPESIVVNCTNSDDDNDGDNDDDDNDKGKEKHHFTTMEIVAIVFACLFVVIVFAISVWSCYTCYNDKKVLKQREIDEIDRINREKNGFIPSSNKEFIKIQMMPKM